VNVSDMKQGGFMCFCIVDMEELQNMILRIGDYFPLFIALEVRGKNHGDGENEINHHL
jgi:hypothetical protein